MTKAKRIKQVLTPPLNRTEVETLVNDIALTVNNQRLITAEMDAHILSIRDQYAAALSLCEEGIDIGTDRVRLWALANPAEFGNAKSIQFAAGKIGFRTGMPKLKNLRKINFDLILDALVKFAPWRKYVRTTASIDKDKLIADHGTGIITDAELNKMALQVVQEESFYVEPKLEEVKTRQTTKQQKAAA